MRALGLSLLLVIFAAAAFWFFAFFVPGRRQEAIDGWIRGLDVRAEIRKLALERYFVDGLEDAQTLAAYPTALQVLDTMSSGRGRPVAGAGVAAAHLEELFGNFVRIHGVLGVVLWDAEGKPRVKSRDLVLDAGCAAPAREVVASGAPATGLHRHAGLDAALTFSAPVRDANGEVHGAVVVEVDPRAWLYPLLAQPLAGTSTGEALIVGRDGADVVFLSPLRDRPGAPLRFRRPLDEPGFAARAALEGSLIVGPYVDYRGVRVLAGGRRIPPSPWGLVVKIDESEALAVFRKDVHQRAVTWGALLVAMLAAAVGLWRWLEVTNEVKLARSEARFGALLEEADDAIFLLSPEGGILDANRRAERMYGADRAALLRWTTADLRAPGEREGAADAIETLNREGRNVVTTVHRRADGSTFPAEVRSRRIQLGTADFLFAIVRDISERKRAEDRILHLNRLLRTISEVNQIIVHVDERKMLISEACRTLVEHGGFRMAWIGFVDSGSSRVVPEARAGDSLSYLDGIEIRKDDGLHGRGPAGTAIRTGKHVVVPNLETDASVAPWRERMLENGFRAVGSFPLSVRGEITGVLTVYRNNLVPFSAEETSLLDELAGDLGYALEVLEIRDESRRAEEALRRVEELFRMAAKASNDVIYEWDLKDGLDWYGDVDGLLGYGAGEFPRTLKGWTESVHPEDLGRVRAAIEAHLEGRATYVVEYRMLRKDGVVRWWSARGAVARGPDGTNVRWVGTITDITDRRLAEIALRESESRFRQLAESLPQLVWTCQPDGPCDYFNRRWLEFTGVPEAPQLGFGWLEQLHPDDRAPAVAGWEAAVASGGDFHTEFRIRRHDGEYRWFDTRAVRLRDAEGRTVKWYGSNTDISERKTAETVLRESEARYRTLLESIPQRIFMKSRTFRYVSVNENYARDLGIRPETAVGKVDYDLFPRELADKYRTDDERVMETGQTEEFEEQYVHGGGEKWTHTIKTPVRDSDGEVIGVLGVFWDITERKLADEALRESEANLRALTEELESRVETRTGEMKAANKELEAFSYSVSHDLRAPLRAVDGFSRILLEDHGEQLDAEGKRLLGVVRSSTRQMGQLIDDLLSFSRVGRQEMARVSVDMKALAEEAFRNLAAADERVSFTVGDLPRAEVDPSLMRQVWVNLISNALKFTRPKAERVIAVAGRTEPGRVVYWVKDNGVGFDMAYANKLFGVFQRLHSSAEFEGTGVGLALVQRIVHRHGGEVWAEGKVGEGATFSFSLPRPGGSS